MNAPAEPVDLLWPYSLGPLRLKNRMVMPPLTRSRAEPGNLPNHLAPVYYSLRAGAGLIVPDRQTFYGGGEKGYIDYPTLDQGQAAPATA